LFALLCTYDTIALRYALCAIHQREHRPDDEILSVSTPLAQGHIARRAMPD
jgi:hypothetical protein